MALFWPGLLIGLDSDRAAAAASPATFLPRSASASAAAAANAESNEPSVLNRSPLASQGAGLFNPVLAGYTAVLPEIKVEGLTELAVLWSYYDAADITTRDSSVVGESARYFPPEAFFGAEVVPTPAASADTPAHRPVFPREQLTAMLGPAEPKREEWKGGKGEEPDATMFPVSCTFRGCPRRFDRTAAMRAHAMQLHRACSTVVVPARSAAVANPRKTTWKGKAVMIGCTHCDMVYPTLAAVQDHEATHATDRPFPCNVCQKRFAKSRTAVAHQQRAHREGRAYSCKVCAKTFVSAKRSSSHARIHTARRPHKCTFCPKLFLTAQLCASHEVTHTGERPFGCEHCPMRFGQRGTATRHQRIHSGEKPYGCSICEKRFNQSGAAKRHERIHTGEKPHKCSFCDRRFVQRTESILHEKTFHNHPPDADDPLTCAGSAARRT